MQPPSTEDLPAFRGAPFLFPEMPRPFSSRVEVDFGAATHVGHVRSTNEDSYLIGRTGRYWERLHTSLPAGQLPARHEENGYLLAVADGMGGHQAGEVASSLALRTVVSAILNAAHWALKLDNPEERAQEVEEAKQRGVEYFRQAHQAINEQASGDAGLARMGTTLTGAYTFGTDLFVMHVGDSRAYLHRGGRLKQLTHDHTLAQELVEAGRLRPEEAHGHRFSHMLTRVLGAGAPEVRPESAHRQLADGDCLLVCSDGLTGMVGDARIAEVLGRGEPAEQACRALVQEALDGGGKDNVTVLVARYRVPGG
jgi:protein phosphatase